MITILGAGFAGLTLAKELQDLGLEVVVLEKSDRAGGLIGTRRLASGLVEKGAPSFNRTKKVESLLEDLNLNSLEPSRFSKKRLFFSQGRLQSWPLGIFETANLIFHYLKSKIFGGMAPHPQESLTDWGERCLTKKATDRLLSTAMQGVYAGDAKKLSASLLLGHLFRSGREKFKGVIGVEGGMERLISALKEKIIERGGEVRFEEDPRIESIEGPIAICTSASVAAEMLEKISPETAKKIFQIQPLPLVTATAFYRQPTGPRAFGCLVRRGEGLRALGILLNGEIFPGRDEKPSETWIFGGATDPEVVKLNDAEIRELIFKERKIVFGKEDHPVEISVQIWPEALPHYDLKLEEILKDLKSPPNIFLHGNWLGGIGLSRILSRSEKLAAQIKKENPS